jgi:beta-D-xylosidase 4
MICQDRLGTNSKQNSQKEVFITKLGCGGPGEPACKNGTNPGRTHRFYSKKPTLPFGFGQSYTSFVYTPVSAPPTVSLNSVRTMLTDAAAAAAETISSAAASDDYHDEQQQPGDNGLRQQEQQRQQQQKPLPGGFVRAQDNHVLAEYYVNVTNTGDIDADDVVLGFLKPPGGGVGGVPLQTLFGFERVHVKAGATVQVYIAAHALDFTTVHKDGTRTAWAGQKRHFCAIVTIKLPSFYQDRLGTNIGKALKKR